MLLKLKKKIYFIFKQEINQKMNKNLFQRILFAILLFSSMQIILIFVDLPLYVQFFLVILAYEYFASFLCLFLSSREQYSEEFSFQQLFICFFILNTFTIFYNNKDPTQVLCFEIFSNCVAAFLLFKNCSCFIKKKTFIYLFCGIIMLSQISIKNYLLNNFLTFNAAFAITRSIKIKNFKNMLLFLMFSWIYEFYWVYENNKLLYILSEIKGPIKVLFPMISGGFSFISIIDVIIPGVILSYCLEFDCFKLQIEKEKVFDIDEKNITYFNFVFSSLFVGMLTLYSVLTNTFKPQAFLCYSIGACVLGVSFLAYKRGEIKELILFDGIDGKKEIKKIK